MFQLDNNSNADSKFCLAKNIEGFALITSISGPQATRNRIQNHIKIIQI